MNKTYRWYATLSAVFVTCLIISNIIAVKIAAFGPFFLPAAVIIFPISYIFGDILTEVYGYSRARQMIWTGFACNLFAVIAIGIGGRLPAAPFWTANVYATADEAQTAYDAILGFTPRLFVASFLAYLVGEFLNSFVLAKMKIATAGRHLWVRTISSTLVAQLADSGVFIALAFAGILPTGDIAQLIVTQWLAKSVYEAAATPVTYAVVNFLKRVENEDYYDRETDFNPLRLK